MRWCLAGAVIAVLAAAPPAVHAAGPHDDAREIRLALIDPPALFADALRAGMAAWDVTVDVHRASDTAGPPSATDEEGARAIAAELEVDAVVWLTPGDAPELWVLDVTQPAALHQPLGTPLPFDEATAAAAALSVKTLLRNGALDPATRAVAEPDGPDPDGPDPDGPDDPPLPLPPPPIRWPAVQLGARIDYHVLGPVELRLGAEFAVHTGLRPRGDLGLDVVAAIATGPGVAIDDPRFVGRVDSLAVLAAPRLAWRRRRLVATLAAGAMLERARVEGVLASGRPGSGGRTDPAAFAEVAAAVAVGERVEVGLHLGVASMIRHHRYTVGGETVLESGAARGWVGVRIAVGL